MGNCTFKVLFAMLALTISCSENTKWNSDKKISDSDLNQGLSLLEQAILLDEWLLEDFSEEDLVIYPSKQETYSFNIHWKKAQGLLKRTFIGTQILRMWEKDLKYKRFSLATLRSDAPSLGGYFKASTKRNLIAIRSNMGAHDLAHFVVHHWIHLYNARNIPNTLNNLRLRKEWEKGQYLIEKASKTYSKNELDTLFLFVIIYYFDELSAYKINQELGTQLEFIFYKDISDNERLSLFVEENFIKKLLHVQIGKNLRTEVISEIQNSTSYNHFFSNVIAHSGKREFWKKLFIEENKNHLKQ